MWETVFTETLLSRNKKAKELLYFQICQMAHQGQIRL